MRFHFTLPHRPVHGTRGRALLFFLLVFLSIGLSAQVTTASISGKVTDGVSEKPVDYVTVYIRGTTRAAESTTTGRYLLSVPAGQNLTIVFSRLGFRETAVNVTALPEGSNKQIDVALVPNESDLEVIVRESKIEEGGMIREQPEALRLLPSTTGNLESILPSIALGVSSGSGGELTSQYNVRGGNYDENLVYVNGFEIYRPQLIRAGQQEGLTFANLDLTRSLSFSSGGFEARYGDKLSSVLDIKYRATGQPARPVFRPVSWAARPTSKAATKAQRRRGDANSATSWVPATKTTRYLLGSLETTGEYIPNFADVQTYLTYDFNPHAATRPPGELQP